ncbi:hypothetical protein EC973_000834 [Apophysomyces ossiformis]|uniref:General negative regulator of transcription subunit 1 n=1 Tax=Apophysomyces ossiformis TaxID=679940 RepID=A0A8H7BKE3_9FUNG|nr:hypothetical protein EC973_000834 [Apophysomyces ossiformis]
MSKSADLFALSKAFFEPGYKSCATIESAMQVMDDVDVHEDGIARTLAMMTRTHATLEGTAEGQSWNVEVFVAAVNKRNPNIDWMKVFAKLDHAEFITYEPVGLKILIDTWNYSHKDQPEHFPVQLFCKRWNNVRGQLSVIYHMLYGPSELLDLSRVPMTRVIQDVHIQGLQAPSRAAAMHLASQQLNCLELIESIIDLADTVVAEDVRVLTERLAIQAPELLLLGLAHIQILVYVLRTDIPYFSLDLACLAARRQHLNMEKWLNDKIVQDKLAFVGSCLEFLEKKLLIEVARQSGTSTVPTLHLSPDVIKVFFRILSDRQLPPPEAAQLAKLIQLYSQLFPQHMDVRNSQERKTVTTTEGDAERSYPPEVEEMVRLYFERLYTKDISPEKFASVLKACQSSKDQRQMDYFSCTVHTLIDEARFFNQYPDNELLATGELLGCLIQQHLISPPLLRVALKHILDALSHPSGTKMFNFGIRALSQFSDRLVEWPQYTALLSKIEDLRAYPMLVRSITDTLQQLSLKEEEVSENVETTSQDVSSKSASLAPNVATLLQRSSDQRFEPPPAKVQERVAFLINNLSVTNMDAKKSELAQLLSESTWEWFSNYLVVRRVSIEPNNHELYALLLNSLKMPQLIDIVVEETYSNVRLLLQSETVVDSIADRNLLKILGSWLGRMTIARNKPIRHKDLSFKDLLLDAYDRDRLAVAIPLTCKVLQHASESKVFQSPNPWLMGILKLLAELYWSENLRLNTKFEIEILFKTLGLSLEANNKTSLEIEPTAILERRSPNAADIPQTQSAVNENANTSQSTSVGRGSTAPEGRLDVDISPLLAKLQFNPAVTQIMLQQPTMKTTIFRAITETFGEIVPNVIATSCSIAAASTKELVLKDFATDPDEIKLRKAAHAMVRPLAGNLAVATCKEPLCNSMAASILFHLVESGLPEVPFAEEIGTAVTIDNLDLTCFFVEQLAQAKAVSDIDRALASAYASRLAYREQGSEIPYVDAQKLGGPHLMQLPDVLRPRNGVSIEQTRLYDAFIQRPFVNQHPVNPMENAFAADSPNIPLGFNANALAMKLEQLLLDLDRLIKQAGVRRVAALPRNHDICLLIRQIPLLISQSSTPPPVLFAFVEKVVYFLYESETFFAMEIYTIFLQALFELSADIAKEVLSWIVYSNDEKKYNANVLAMLIRYGLIPLEEYDVQLAQMINTKAENAIEFAAYLVNVCVLSTTPVSFLEDHILTIAALRKLAEQNVAPASVMSLMQGLRAYIEQPYANVKRDVDCLELRMLFAEWVRLYQHPRSIDPLFRKLAKKISEAVKDTEAKCFFFRLCTEICVYQGVELRPANAANQRRVIQLIDAFTKLVTYMVLVETGNEENEDDSEAKLKLLSDVLSVIVLLLAHQHETQGANFNQKAFSRILSSLLSDITKVLPEKKGAAMITIFSDVLYTLQPSRFPGFAFSWLQLISHRTLLSQLLVAEGNDGWITCQKLVLALLKFLCPLLQDQVLQQATKVYYRGTLRVLVVLLHDFPEFLCRNYMVFAQVIPHTCIQLRNLILSAFPRVMHLPDPFTSDVSPDQLPESREKPTLNEDYIGLLEKSDFKTVIDNYVKHPDESFYTQVLERITNKETGAYRLELLDSFVLYLGSQTATVNVPFGNHPAVLVFKYLLGEMTAEDQPEPIKEQITRVLLERLIVNRPHPWGLLSSFIEIIKSDNFWQHPFIRCSPDIEKLFDNVSRSIKIA